MYCFVRRDIGKVTCFTAKFQEDPIDRSNHLGKSPGEVKLYDEHSSLER